MKKNVRFRNGRENQNSLPFEDTKNRVEHGDYNYIRSIRYEKGLKSKLRQCVHCTNVIKAIIKIEVVYEIQTK